MIEFKCHYDGTSIVLDEPVKLPVNTPLIAKVDDELVQPKTVEERPQRIFGQFRGLMSMSPDFNDELVLTVKDTKSGTIESSISDEANQSNTAKRVWGQFAGMGWMSEDFNDPLPDSFWDGEE